MGKPALESQPSESLLDQAIREHKIPRWPYRSAFDRIVVFSLPEDKASRETYVPGGKIVKAETTKSREQNETPRGIIVSAGLQAMDELSSHGMGLGHMVWVARLSPWRHVVDRDSDGRDIEFLFLRAGDVVGSETLEKWIADGDVKIACDDEGRHHYDFADAGMVPRFDPPSFIA